MTTTPRDRVLLMILPTLLVVMGYGWFFLRSANKAVADASMRLDNALAKAPSPEQLMASRAMMLSLRREIDALEREKRDMQGQWQTLAGRHAGGAGRAHAGARLTDLLSRHHLVLLHEGPTETGGKEGRPPEGLRKLAAQLNSTSAGPAGATGMNLWRVQVVGRFPDVLAAVEELSSEESVALPVSLKMEEARAGTDARSWVLVVWI